HQGQDDKPEQGHGMAVGGPGLPPGDREDRDPGAHRQASPSDRAAVLSTSQPALIKAAAAARSISAGWATSAGAPPRTRVRYPSSIQRFGSRPEIRCRMSGKI